MKKFSSLVFLSLLLSPFSLGEEPKKEEENRREIPLFSIESRFLPTVELEDPHPGTFEENAEVDVQYLQARVLLPWRKKTETTSINASCSYESLSFDYHNWNESADPTIADQLHVFQLPISIRTQLRQERWSLYSFITPGFNSDFKSFSSRAFRLQGGILLSRFINQRTLSMGLVFINDYGAPRVYPAVAYSGKIGEKNNIVVRLPVQLSWGYDVSDQTEAGLAARVSGNNFYISEKGRYRSHTARYSVASVGPYIRWRPAPSYVLSLETGYAFHHDLEYWDGNDKARDLDFRRSGIILAGFRWLL